MVKIQFLCAFMIWVEIYHFVFHNKIYQMCKPLHDRIKFLNKFQQMKSYFYSARLFATRHPSNNLIRRFSQQYESELDYIQSHLEGMPSIAELIEKFIINTSSKVMRVAIISCIIEMLYFVAFIWLLILVPVAAKWGVCVSIMVLSCIHSINEGDEKMILPWFPFVDSMVCIIIYTITLFMYGIGIP